MTDRETWLSTIRANPSDWQAMLVFADWLEEEGDLLAAEQWRFIAAHDVYWRNILACIWQTVPFGFRLQPNSNRNIRCMPTYPQTIADVQAYLETAQ